MLYGVKTIFTIAVILIGLVTFRWRIIITREAWYNSILEKWMCLVTVVTIIYAITLYWANAS